MSNIEHSPLPSKPVSGSIVMRFTQEEVGALIPSYKLPHIGRDRKPQTLEEKYPGINFVDLTLTHLKTRIGTLDPANLEAGDLERIKHFISDRAYVDNMDNAALVTAFSDKLNVQGQEFAADLYEHIKVKVENHGLEIRHEDKSYFESDSLSVKDVYEQLIGVLEAGAGSKEVVEKQKELDGLIDKLAVAHVRANGIGAIELFLNREGMPTLAELHNNDEAEIQNILSGAGLNNESVEEATKFIQSNFKDKATTTVDFDKYAQGVSALVMSLNQITEGEMTFDSSGDLIDIMGVVQVNADDALRVDQSKIRRAAIELALDKTGGKFTRKDVEVEVIDDSTDTLIVGNSRKVKKVVRKGKKLVAAHKVASGAAALGVLGAAALGAAALSRGGDSDSGEYGYDGSSAETTNTRTIGSTSNSDLEITQTVFATTQEALNDAVTSTAIQTSTATSEATATSDAGGGEQIELSGDVDQEKAFDAMDMADGDKDQKLTIQLENGEEFTDAVSRVLTGVANLDEGKIENYSNFLQYQFAADLGGAVPREAFTFDSNQLHRDVYILRSTDSQLTDSQKEFLKLNGAQYDRSVDIEWPQDVIDASEQEAIKIAEFVDKLKHDQNTSSNLNGNPDAAKTVTGLTVAGTGQGAGEEKGEDHYGDRNTPTVEAIEFAPTRTVEATQTVGSLLTTTAEVVACDETDIDGKIIHDLGGFYSSSSVRVILNNNSDVACTDDISLHMYGSMQEPESEGWLESQTGNHIKTEVITVGPNDHDREVIIEVPNLEYCWRQIDLTQDSEIKDTPYYATNDYAFVKDEDSCLPATNTPTPTPTYTYTATVTSTHTPAPRTATFTPGPKTPTEVPTDVPATNTAESTPTDEPTATPVPPTETATVFVPQLPKTGSYEPHGHRIPTALPIAAGVGAAAISTGWAFNRKRNSEDEYETVTSKIAES